MEGRNRRSPTGFIHGYRYTVRALFRILEDRYEGVPTPSQSFALNNADDLRVVADHMIKRISLSSGLYETYGIMCDTLVIDKEQGKVDLFYELPADYILEQPYFSDKKIMLFTLEYGFDNFPGADPNSFVRRNDPERPGCAAYLHPVFRYYENGVFVKGRNTRSSAVIRYDAAADDFEGDFWPDKALNIVRNFVNEIAKVTEEVYPEDHHYNNEERGGFTAWPEGERVENHGLPMCALTVGGPQVRDFEHLTKLPAGSERPVPPWVHTM
jgi:hypothetical protein